MTPQDSPQKPRDQGGGHPASFRPASFDDIAPVLGLMAVFYREDGYPFDPVRLRNAISELLGNPELGKLWVLAAANTISGYVLVTFSFSLEFGGRDAIVDELFLAEDVRGRGYGRAALDIAEAYCRERRVGAIHISAELHRQRAHDLYLRHGFVEHSRRLMTKRL